MWSSKVKKRLLNGLFLMGYLGLGALSVAHAEDTEYYKKMVVSANKNWPLMESSFKVEEGFDPAHPAAFKGKYIKIVTDNLMGYRFKVGDFPFATTLDGYAIAAKYAPAVKTAIAQVEKELDRSLGDNDDDGRWTIIARVEGTQGKMRRRVKIDVAGTSVEKAEAVDAPIITIVAAHIGPLSVATDKGMAQEDGKVKN